MSLKGVIANDLVLSPEEVVVNAQASVNSVLESFPEGINEIQEEVLMENALRVYRFSAKIVEEMLRSRNVLITKH
jgi:hypothetical protein